MWEDIAVIIKNRISSILEQTTYFLGESFKKMYLRLLISLSSMAIIYSSFVALINKLADRLDANELDLWSRSMSLYFAVLILSAFVLKITVSGIHRDSRERPSSPNATTNRISQRKANGRRRKNRRRN